MIYKRMEQSLESFRQLKKVEKIKDISSTFGFLLSKILILLWDFCGVLGPFFTLLINS